MKRFQVLVLCAAAIWVGYQSRAIPIYAASAVAQSVNSGTAAGQLPGSQAAKPTGAQAYAEHCAICHGEQREGTQPGFPPLVGVGRHMTDQQITTLIHGGKGRMPAFPTLPPTEVTALLHFLASDNLPMTQVTAAASSTSIGSATASSRPSGPPSPGGALFQQNCAFCHGRDTQGGETGPDLTRSKLVHADVKGDKISEVVRNGRPEKKMPAFNFSAEEMLSLAEFIHAQEARAVAQKGKRKGVDVADLQTGNVEAGHRYFDGAGTCATCHSTTGDLAGIAKRYEGLQLEQRMLYPKDAKSRVTVVLPSGQQVTGTVAYKDEFTIALRESDGIYKSWPAQAVKYTLDAPVQAHADLFSRYTDDDIHNLMAYLQTLR